MTKVSSPAMTTKASEALRDPEATPREKSLAASVLSQAEKPEEPAPQQSEPEAPAPSIGGRHSQWFRRPRVSE